RSSGGSALFGDGGLAGGYGHHDARTDRHDHANGDPHWRDSFEKIGLPQRHDDPDEQDGVPYEEEVNEFHEPNLTDSDDPRCAIGDTAGARAATGRRRPFAIRSC